MGKPSVDQEYLPVFDKEKELRDFTLPRLKEDEGSKIKNGRHIPYTDTKGFITIGYGYNLSAKGMSEEEATNKLEESYQEALEDVKSLFPKTWGSFSLMEQSALVNLTFNMGKGGMSTFKVTLPLLRKGEIEAAVSNFKVSKWSRDVKPSRTRRVLGLLLNKDYYKEGKKD